MSRASDKEILARASELSAVVVTLDADFHTILAVPGAQGPSVIRLRLQGLGAAAVTETLQNVVTAFSSELHRGVLVTVKEHKTACHLLPVGSGLD